MRELMKKITFKLIKPKLNYLYEKPSPASRHVPEWFKHTPLRTPGETVDGIAPEGGTSNFTIKGCVPFLDVMTTGYMMVTPCDVEVSFFDDQSFQIRWLVDDYTPATQHHQNQLGNLPRVNNSDHSVFKWENPWILQTPPGYSTIFTHPINRHDLPFRSFGGVVETDTYNLPVNFPFQITKVPEEKYIIPKGTPVIQAIPFKREDWQSNSVIADAEEFAKNYNALKSVIVRSYRKTFWKKKRYL